MWRIVCLTFVWVLCAPLWVQAGVSGASGGSGTSGVSGVPVNLPFSSTGSTVLLTVNTPVPPPGSAISTKNTSPAEAPNLTAVPAAKLAPDMVISRKTTHMRIDVHYPELGIAAIDEDIHSWATQLADNFQNEFAGETADARAPYDLSTTYTLLRPAADTAVTVVWEVASYTQGAHGNLDIVTYSYALPGGEPLTLSELFADLGTALNFLSERSYAQLSRTLGDMFDEDMLRGGTSPDPDNFSSFALIPGALRVYFQPYQVAPWVAGLQSVDIPLEELEDAGPQYVFWGGKKDALNVPDATDAAIDNPPL